MKNTPPESVMVSGWTAYVAMRAIQRRVRRLEERRAVVGLCDDRESELRAATRALDEILGSLSSKSSIDIRSGLSDAADDWVMIINRRNQDGGSLKASIKFSDDFIASLSPAPFPASPEPAEATPQTEQEAAKCPFSQQELWDALRVALPDVLYLEPGFPRDDYSFLPLGYLRQDCSRLKKLADEARAANEERERAAKKYRCLRRFSPAWAKAALRAISCALSP